MLGNHSILTTCLVQIQTIKMTKSVNSWFKSCGWFRIPNVFIFKHYPKVCFDILKSEEEPFYRDIVVR